MPTTRITELTYEDRDRNERAQYRTTVPPAVVELLDLENNLIDWTVTGDDVVELRPVDPS